MMQNGIVELDLHGKNTYQARVAIDAVLRHSRGIYRIRLIHGYHAGQTLREMIAREYTDHPGVLELRAGENPGITELVLRRL